MSLCETLVSDDKLETWSMAQLAEVLEYIDSISTEG